jgi:hypothetical protein
MLEVEMMLEELIEQSRVALAASSPPIFIAGEASVSVFGVSMMVVTSV